jgi:hypothetical protein
MQTHYNISSWQTPWGNEAGEEMALVITESLKLIIIFKFS